MRRTDVIIQLEGLRERCKLPLWGMEQSPSRLLFWCILSFTEGLWSLERMITKTFCLEIPTVDSVHHKA